MQYQLNLSLRQQEALRSGISFWERKEIKVKVAEFIETLKEIETSEVEFKYRKFTKIVVDEWMKDMLPRVLNDDMIHTVRMIGETIFNWYQHINREYKMEDKAINCIESIKWTPYGTVDAVKVFESFLLNNPNIDITKVYKFACHYAIEDHINNLWDKIPHNMQNDCYKDIYKRFDQHILAYWKHRRESDLPKLMRYFQVAANSFNEEDMRVFKLIYDESRSTEENILRISVYQGYFNATKFFWEQLTEVERDESVVKCARITALSYFNECGMTTTRDHQRSQYSEICVFLMNQMAESHKKAFFNEELYAADKILEMLLCTRSGQRLFILVLTDMIQHQDDNSIIPYRFLQAITFQITQDHKLGYSLKTSTYRRLFRRVWLSIPASIKQKIVPHCGRVVIDNLIEVLDLDTLKSLFNDSENIDVRDELIDSLLSSLTNLIRLHNFDKLNEILDVVCRSAEEAELFKKKIADVNFCKDSINIHTYRLVDKLVDLRFDTDEEKKKFKDRFKSDIFSIKQICEVWSECYEDIDLAKDKCSRFLHWFLESEKEIALFKKGIIAKLESGESTMNNLIQLKRHGILDDFISWCSSNDE